MSEILFSWNFITKLQKVKEANDAWTNDYEWNLYNPKE